MNSLNWTIVWRHTAILLTLLLLFVGLQFVYIHKHAFDYDEGHWLMFGTLAARGYQPYSEIFVGIPPLALLTIQFGAALFGSALSVRTPMMLYSLIGIASIYFLVKRQVNSTAGLLAAGLLAFNPEYFTQSTTIMTEVPAIALALLSLAMADYYRVSPKYIWLILSGAAFAASLALKVFVIFIPVVIFGQLLIIASNSLFEPHRNKSNKLEIWRTLLRLGFIWGVGFATVCIFFLLIYPPYPMSQQVLQFRVLIRAAEQSEGLNWTNNIKVLVETITTSYLPVLAVAVVGLIIGNRKFIKNAWIWPTWMGLAAIMLLTHVPLRPRYVIILLPSFAALSSIALVKLMVVINPYLKLKQSVWHAIFNVGIITLLIIAGPIQILAAPSSNAFAELNKAHHDAANFIEKYSVPNDCTAVDDQRFALMANRLVPPQLSETSRARLLTHMLTTDTVMADIQTNHCTTLVYTNDRFDDYLPDLSSKAAEYFSLKLVFSQPDSKWQATVFMVPVDTQQFPAIPIHRRLSDLIELKGIDLNPNTLSAGQELTLATYWTTLNTPDTNYKIFLHLKDEVGNVVVAYDHYPFTMIGPDSMVYTMPKTTYNTERVQAELANYPGSDFIPTRLWIPGNTLKETIPLAIPPNLSPGTYHLSIGMYREDTGERLSTEDNLPGHENNEIVLDSITIE